MIKAALDGWLPVSSQQLPTPSTHPLSAVYPPFPHRARHLHSLEMAGTWEGCCWEGGPGSLVAAVMPPCLSAMTGVASSVEQQQPTAGPGEADNGDGEGAASPQTFAPGWLQAELYAGGTGRALVQDGWQALQLQSFVDVDTAPRGLAEMVGIFSGSAARRGDAAQWASVAQLVFLVGLTRMLAGTGHARDEGDVTTGIR